MSPSHLTIPFYSFKLAGGLFSLTTHSAEVNIGIVAACLPTLLPLYRLIHDKIIAVRKNVTSKTGRFPRLWSGQSHKANISSPKALRGSQKRGKRAIPPNAQWAHSASRTFIRFEKAEDEDIEMQTRFVESL